ncbi:hypothetical protein IFM58399_04036 [Aspergillus lentulus]|uniref:putative AT DNA binding protein n=1 Tax=Aspergillus lentulus TaxID=293939 RepID=UPI001394B352|nr:uncharacterized protein IFM58399_04036 [Aspergillus lentulus]GFF34920.1 hypothetical protein IFM58399_04036 [Aspergillus lentulus]GFF63492.1 hypothetical protein IFM62136_05657 [Aspergillus lentulus]GFG10972.1 hypothetical protein IFM61392_06671 [Aspergillus lentulus]
MFSQSSSSSPDILGPPGDADYLISSPIRPFSGRQSFMSPANFKLLQTPRTGKGKRSRINLSPAKGAHSIRFDDVLLPVSPTRQLNGRQRSLSPEKAQADGNLSPWRIRVTLEATQDEEMNQGSPARKRPRPSTATTVKIPLKDAEEHAEQSPKRRRGRPRKSDIREQDAMPTAGSPGHTPGPAGASGQKRKRGRPRKQSLNPDTVEGDKQVADSADHQDTRPAEPELEAGQRWSPLNLAGDADSEDDALPEGFMPVDAFPEDNNMGQSDAAAWDRSSPRIHNERTYDTPDVTAVDQIYGQNHDEEPQSTPSKMPSPSRESQGFSPENTLHAGHTPRPPRSYPSPTSSLGDDDRAVQVESRAHSGQEQNTTRPTNDPTEEHREFDSIMESEGFSMVSLDTLPSVKQHGLSINSQNGNGALKPFLAREKMANTEKLKRKVSSLNLNPRMDSPDVEVEKESRLQATEPQALPVSAEKRQSAPILRESPAPAFVPKQRNPLARLARIIRAGVALEGTLRRPYEGAPVPTPGTPDLREQISSLEAPKRRLELLFSDLHPRMRRELRAGLGFAQELAKRRRKTEIERARQTASAEARLMGNARGAATTPQQVLSGTAVKDTPSTEMKRRLEEWQREREAVSREIQLANASQVIVVDSDTTGPPSPELDANGDKMGSQSDEEADPGGSHGQELGDYEAREVYDEDRRDQDVNPGESPQHDFEADQAEEVYEEEDEEGYEDIWQQEARDHSNISQRSSTLHGRENDDVEARQEPNPSESSPAPGEPRGIFSPKSWTYDNAKVPFLGHSRVKKLREETVDLSAVLRGEETPRHIRRYYGQSSPEKSANGDSPEQQRSNLDFLEENAEDYGIEDDQGSRIYLESSPNRASDDDTFQIDPTTRHESEMQRADQMAEEIEDEHIPTTALADTRSAYEENSTTPAQNREFGGDGQASTWFQKITSLTPGWLKAPVRKSFGPASPGSEEVSEEEPEEEPDVRSANAQTLLDDQLYPKETHETSRQGLQSPEQNNAQPDSPMSSAVRPVEEVRVETYEPHFPLAVSGYFTDNHYLLLRRLYRLAKRHPERFPYYPAPGRSDIIGDWIWTSDGEHGVRVTETQFAIIDRFVQELARGDLQAGGTGQIGWTEADMHRRLISIIIGERIREEMKAEMGDKTSAQQIGGRGAALTAWRG